MAKYLITGGSGLLGKSLTKVLLKNGHSVNWLIRTKKGNTLASEYIWNLQTGTIELNAFDGVDVIVHLAGSGVMDKRWTSAYKKEIIDSRVSSTKLLADTLIKHNIKIKKFIGASAIGYYGGITNNDWYTEESKNYNDFLGQCCKVWEDSYQMLPKEIPLAIVRIGIVLSANGGALPKMAGPAKIGLGSALGSGKQFISWIHIDDLVGIIFHLSTSEDIGIYNGVAGDDITNNDFTRLLCKTLSKPFFLPKAPSWILKIVLGEGAVAVTEGLKVSSKKICDTGFIFKYIKAEDALKNLLT